MTDEELRAAFRRRFGAEARVSRAPGRVNLIGEHTDYNDGFVLPMAIDRMTRVAFAPLRGEDLVLCSSAFPDETVRIPLDGGEPKRQWTDYVEGVLRMLQAQSIEVGGAGLFIHSDVPLGAGLSSSAALEVAVAGALLGIAGREMAPVDVALLCQRAENEFVGTRCGIMDQFISCLARPRHALRLDCRSRGVDWIEIPDRFEILVLDTGVRHELAAGAYNRRRADCEVVVGALAQRAPRIRALRDADRSSIEALRGEVDEIRLRRALHVVTENARVSELVSAFRSDDEASIAAAMAASHRSLRDDFEVSCRELDLLVELANRQEGVVGARMTGGGFGGCTVNVVEAGRARLIHEAISAEYEIQTGHRADGWVTHASSGARVD